MFLSLCLQPCFFRLPVDGFFVGAVHELFISEDDSPPSQEQLLSDVSFSQQKSVDKQALLGQEKKMLQEYLGGTPPIPARWFFYLGEALEQLGDVMEAAGAFERSAGVATSNEEAAWALYRAALCHQKAQAKTLTVQLLTQALAKQPSMPEAAWLLALVAYHAGRYADATSWTATGAAQGCFKGLCTCRSRKRHRDVFTWFGAPYDIQRFAYPQLGDESAAAEAQANYVAAGELLEKYREEEEPVMGLHQMSKRFVVSGWGRGGGPCWTHLRPGTASPGLLHVCGHGRQEAPKARHTGLRFLTGHFWCTHSLKLLVPLMIS